MRTFLVVTVALFLVVAYCSQLQVEAKPKAVIVPDDPKPFGGAAIIRGGRRLLDLNRRGAKEDDDDKEPNITRGQQKQGETGDPNRLFFCAESTANCLVALEYFDHENVLKRAEVDRLNLGEETRRTGRPTNNHSCGGDQNGVQTTGSANGEWRTERRLARERSEKGKREERERRERERGVMELARGRGFPHKLESKAPSIASFVVFASLVATEAKRLPSEDQFVIPNHDLIRKQYSNVFGPKVLTEDNDNEPNTGRGDQSKNGSSGQNHHLIFNPKGSDEPTDKRP
ncbi:hypothetical protein L484_006363 [Morus notabilis]|uniref:Uncharacterized protein n=1 Tax=Morus notabilis TaxID=981085 RepID=W9SGZ3_9ROSA|nr:hypothetical protein L484_006363 [Morus notabilis]